MPRFVALPVTVEAYEWTGHLHMFPDAFRMAVRRQNHNGTVDVMTDDGLRSCRHGDWIVRGPNGDFSVLRGATFETMYQEHVPPVVAAPVRSRRSEVLA
jgi:hypothetical protein